MSIVQWFKKRCQSPPQSSEDWLAYLAKARQSPCLPDTIYTMIHHVITLSDMKVSDIMVPKARMVTVSKDASLHEWLPIIVDSAHSRFPVTGADDSDIIGILLAKDLLQHMPPYGDQADFSIRRHLRPAVFIPESKRLDVLLNEFKDNRHHLAIVVDEYAQVTGLVTIEDVLEQIVGDIIDEHDAEEDDVNIVEHQNETYLVNALTPINEFNDYFGTHFDQSEQDTVGGLILKAFAKMPKREDSITLGHFRFIVTQATDRRIEQLKVVHLTS